MFDENISVLVPFKPDGGYRDKDWEWLKRRYEFLMPNAELCIADSDITPYCRSAAVNNAAKQASRDILVIADADIAFDIKLMETAVKMLSNHAWVIPHEERKELNEAHTIELLKKDPAITMSDDDFTGCVSFPYGVSSIILVPRRYFEYVGGFDERFKGWGYEDNAFAMAMDVLCGPHARLQGGVIWHLYHHPQYLHPRENYDLICSEYGSREALLAARGFSAENPPSPPKA